MEPSPNSKKRLVTESSSRCMDDVVVVLSKGKQVILPDVDEDTAIFTDVKVEGSIKGKVVKYSSNYHPGYSPKGAVTNNFVGSSGSSFASPSHNTNYADLFLDDTIDVDEYARLQAHFDNVDIPPGVEAPIPTIPWLLDPPTSGIDQVYGSSSGDTNYEYATGVASSFPNLIALGSSSDAFNSKSDYSDLYLDEHIDIDEYALMVSHFDNGDIPSGVETSLPDILSSVLDPPKSNVKAASTSSSYMKTQEDTVSHSLGIRSSWKPPHASSSNNTLYSLQHLGSASNFSVESSNSQTETQLDVPAKQVSSMDTDVTMMKFKGFEQFDIVGDHSDHYYTKQSYLTTQKNWAKKIQEEWKILEKDLPDTIFVRVYETRMDLLRAVIVGAEGTPYHDGLFFFDVSFPSGYPNVPPQVHYHSGGLRLNPNLYNCGKVCLSLLNTWSGNTNEKWIPGMSTMLQVLVSIQGLILNTDPYFNEPAYESLKGKPDGETQSKRYNEETFILSLRTMVYTMKKPPKYFEDFVLGHFRNRGHDILASCKTYMDGAKVGCLVKGQVQGGNGSQSCSREFENSVAGVLPTLVTELTKIGAKD